jgi:hypothetical protein
MKSIALPLGILALLGTIVPPLLYLTGSLADGPMKLAMLASAIVWFVTAPMWMRAS